MSSSEKEKAEKILNNTNFWISNVDNKISFILGFTGVFLGFIFASDSITASIQNYITNLSEINVKELSFILSLIGIALFGFTIYYIIRAVHYFLEASHGRINPKKIKESGLETNSSIFWGTIASRNYKNFKKTFDETDEQELNDIKSQAYINSKIAKIKFVNYNSGIKKLKRSIIIFISFKLFTYIW